MSQNSRMQITGKNFLIALLIAFTITVILTFIYSCMASFLNFNTKEDVNISAVINYLSQSFVSLFKFVGMCAAPIIFLLSFALLQRFNLTI
jgi:flagellar biosynthesis protein FliR